MREAGLQALERFNERFTEWAKRTNEGNRKAAENIETQRQEWEETFKSSHIPDHTPDQPLVHSCIEKWEQLEPIFEEAMRGRPYDELWRQLLKDARLVSWEQWLNRWLDRSAAEILEQAARNLWRNQLEGEKVKRLSTYLKDDAQSQKLLEECYDQASKFLWRQVGSGTQLRWALKPEGENNLAEMGEKVLGQRYGNIRDWQSLTLPGIVGYLQVAEVLQI
ncbi:MAG: hypothetical protein NZ805_16135 [Armatimonadetes bacterium]|nr:hypothetical protein [Armatimonadota bacterium]